MVFSLNTRLGHLPSSGEFSNFCSSKFWKVIWQICDWFLGDFQVEDYRSDLTAILRRIQDFLLLDLKQKRRQWALVVPCRSVFFGMAQELPVITTNKIVAIFAANFDWQFFKICNYIYKKWISNMQIQSKIFHVLKNWMSSPDGWSLFLKLGIPVLENLIRNRQYSILIKNKKI